MPALTAKQEKEQRAFRRFIARLNQVEDWTSVDSRNPPEPDLLCVHSVRGAVAFELVSLTDPKIAKIQAAGLKATQSAFATTDPSTVIVLDKLQCTYRAAAERIELLVYTDGQIITPDDVIVPTIEPLIAKNRHPFSEVWFMGEYETKSLWRDS